jgi:hypothetical protein
VLCKQKQRYRLRGQQRGVEDQRLGGPMQLRRLVNGEGERPRYGQSILILGRRMARIIEQSHRGRLETLAVVGE